VDIIDIEPADPRLVTDVLPVLQELRTHLTAESLERIYAEGRGQGLRFTAAYAGSACVGVAGWRFVVNTSAGRKLYVDDLVATAGYRSNGVGKALLDELEKRARAEECVGMDLDSGVQRSDAHRFYMREGMTIRSFHFARIF
jgi:GNAT superfamily N-acetyltransferase